MPESMTDLIDPIDERARKIVRQEMRGSIRSKVDPSYSGSGAVKERRTEETSTPNITKPVLLAFGLANETGAAVASDEIVVTPDGRYILGKIGDPGGSVNANKWGGHSWVTPGNDATLLSANTERSTTSTTFTELKRFNLANPGRYRISCELARSLNSTEAKLQLLLLDAATWIDVSGVATSTATYPTFSSHTLDMTVTANCAGMILRVVIRNTVAGTSYIQNVSVKYDVTSVAPALYSAVITD